MLTNTITQLFPDAAFPLLVMIADAIICGDKPFFDADGSTFMKVFEREYAIGSTSPAGKLIDDFIGSDGDWSRSVALEEDKKLYLEWRHMTPELIQEFRGMTTYEIQRSLGVPCP